MSGCDRYAVLIVLANWRRVGSAGALFPVSAKDDGELKSFFRSPDAAKDSPACSFARICQRVGNRLDRLSADR